MPMGRMFYPRNFQVSEDFINAFHREYDRLIGEGSNPKTLFERLSKAMHFHVKEKRKYNALPVEGKRPDPHWLKKKKKPSIVKKARQQRSQFKQGQIPSEEEKEEQNNWN